MGRIGHRLWHHPLTQADWDNSHLRFLQNNKEYGLLSSLSPNPYDPGVVNRLLRQE